MKIFAWNLLLSSTVVCVCAGYCWPRLPVNPGSASSPAVDIHHDRRHGHLHSRRVYIPAPGQIYICLYKRGSKCGNFLISSIKNSVILRSFSSLLYILYTFSPLSIFVSSKFQTWLNLYWRFQHCLLYTRGEGVTYKQGCGSGSGSGRIRNVLPGSGSGMIEKKKVGRFNIFPLKEGGGGLTGNC